MTVVTTVLVVLACVAVLSLVGVWVHRQWKRVRARADPAQLIENALARGRQKQQEIRRRSRP